MILDLAELLLGQRLSKGGSRNGRQNIKHSEWISRLSEVLDDSQFIFLRKHSSFNINKRNSHWLCHWCLASPPSSEMGGRADPQWRKRPSSHNPHLHSVTCLKELTKNSKSSQETERSFGSSLHRNRTWVNYSTVFCFVLFFSQRYSVYFKLLTRQRFA